MRFRSVVLAALALNCSACARAGHTSRQTAVVPSYCSVALSGTKPLGVVSCFSISGGLPNPSVASQKLSGIGYYRVAILSDGSQVLLDAKRSLTAKEVADVLHIPSNRILPIALLSGSMGHTEGRESDAQSKCPPAFIGKITTEQKDYCFAIDARVSDQAAATKMLLAIVPGFVLATFNADGSFVTIRTTEEPSLEQIALALNLAKSEVHRISLHDR